MRKIALILVALISTAVVNAQAITQTPEWTQLLNALQNENWQEANDLSNQCLKKAMIAEPEDNMPAVLRYMVILSESGLMNDGKISQEKALSDVKGFEGKPIVLPGHPITAKLAFNSVNMVNGKTDSLYVPAGNKNKTEIFAFEYIALSEKWPVEDFKASVGKVCRLSGTLSSITVEGHLLPRFRIIINDAQYDISN